MDAIKLTNKVRNAIKKSTLANQYIPANSNTWSPVGYALGKTWSEWEIRKVSVTVYSGSSRNDPSPYYRRYAQMILDFVKEIRIEGIRFGVDFNSRVQPQLEGILLEEATEVDFKDITLDLEKIEPGLSTWAAEHTKIRLEEVKAKKLQDIENQIIRLYKEIAALEEQKASL